MKTVIPKKLLLGLCAYLSQLELSIDRSLGNLMDFKVYCETGSTERLPRVIDRLEGFIPNVEWSTVTHKEHVVSSFFTRLFGWYFQRGVSVDTVLLKEIRDLLKKIEVHLDPLDGLNRYEFVKIRMSLNMAVDRLSCRIFPLSKRKATRNVEHFNQNFILKANSIEVIAGGGNWLTDS